MTKCGFEVHDYNRKQLTKHLHNLIGEVVVAPLVARSLPTPEIHDYNPDININLPIVLYIYKKTEIMEKVAGMSLC